MDLSKTFKELIWDALVGLALKQLFTTIPWLAWGPIGAIVGIIVGRFGNLLFDFVREYINLELIVLRKQGLAKAYSEQALALKLIALEKGVDSDEFKAQREKAKTALSDFIKFNG